MAQPRWDPFAGIASLQREINRLLEDFFAGRPQASRGTDTHKPAVEVIDTSEALIVRVQVPGISRDDLHLSVTNETLTITGNVREAEAGHNTYQHEFHYGPFSRTVTLPVSIQADRAAAQLKDGILTITLPKKSVQDRGQDIPIQS